MPYTRLPACNLDEATGLLHPACILPERVELDNTALGVMTDFLRLTAFIATPGDTIKQAEERMTRRKVHLLFVMDVHDRVAGLVTSTGLHGEKPLQGVQSRGIRRDEVLVADTMTPVEQLEAVDYDDIVNARVGHVLETLKARGRQHALVIEQSEGRQMVCGHRPG
ncbi:CBS domain-containing protein [Thiobacillus sp.]